MTTLLVAAFLLLQLVCQVLATVECGGELPSGYVKYPGDNTAIKIHMERLTWNDARDRCIAEGAQLPVAITAQKIQHIRNRSGELFMWLGIHRPTGVPGGDWVRVDTGLPVPSSSLPWMYFRDVSNCAMTWGFESITDWRCTETLPFACEISLAEGCPDPVGSQSSQGAGITSRLG